MTKPTSEQVTFLAAGSGASQRTVLNKLRDVVSVKDFGAVGDGVADDTAAINAAIAYLKGPAVSPPGTAADNNKTLYFPAGVYNFSEAVPNFGLYVNSPLKIVGDGPTRTVLKNTSATGAGIRCASGWIIIQDLTIDQNGSTGIGLRCPGQYGVIRNVQIMNQAGATTYAFVADNSTLVEIDSLHILNATNGISIGATNPTQYLTFKHCTVEFSMRGMTTGLATGCSFYSLYLESTPVSATVHAIEMVGSTSASFYNLGCEVTGNAPTGTGAAFFHLRDCKNVHVYGGRLYDGLGITGSCSLWRISSSIPFGTTNISFNGLTLDTNSSSITLFTVQDSPSQVAWKDIRSNGSVAGIGIDYTGSSGNGLVVLGWQSRNAAFPLKLRSNDMYVCNVDSATDIEIIASSTNCVIANCRGVLSGAGASLVTNLDTFHSNGAALWPKSDGTADLGLAGNRWDVVYAVTPTINTSDEREKQDIRGLSAAEMATAAELRGLLRAFRFRTSVASKGEGARIHVGIIAQQVAEAFARNGLDASEYGMFCRDEWIDAETGQAVERYGVRYEELLAFIIGGTTT